MDFSGFLATFYQDLKIDEQERFENSTETSRKNIFYGLVVYDSVRFTSINKIRQ